MSDAPLVIDPGDPALRADPYPAYRRWRDQQPRWHAPDGAVIVARHHDVEALLRNRGISSSQPGGEAGAPVAALAEHGRWVMIASDAPDHPRRRGVVAPAFTPAAVAALRPTVAAHVDDLLDGIDHHEPIDLVDAFTSRLPILTIGTLLALPPADTDRVRTWTAAFTDGLEPWAGPDAEARSERALEEMGEYLGALLDERRRHPGDDMLSTLAVSDDLNDDEALQNGLLLLNAGLDTSGDLLANVVATLHQHPEQWFALCAAPAELVAGAVEEVLRYESPVQFSMRRTFPLTDPRYEPTPLGLEPGQPLLLALGAANRDPAAFADPDRFDMTRSVGGPDGDRRPLAFGGGAHLCLGAPLARLEAAVALTAVAERFPTLDVVGHTPWRDRLFFRGIAELPVRLSPGH